MKAIQQPASINSATVNLWRYIVITCLLAGTMDALAGIFLLAHGDAVGMFEGIASGLFGQRALAGGIDMIIAGILIHYFIAGCFSAFYFFIYHKVPLLKKAGWSIALYGLFVWAVMRVVLYLAMNMRTFNPIKSLEGCIILMITIGVPCTLMMRKFVMNEHAHTSNRDAASV